MKNKFLSMFLSILMVVSVFAMLAGTTTAATTATVYTVTFTESGLPSGTTWGVANNITLTNTTYNATGSIVFSEPNGTYNYHFIGTPWYFNNTTVSETVNGANISVTVHFIENYTLTVHSILPSLAPPWRVNSSATLHPPSWSVSINGQNYTSTAQYQHITLAAGTYSVAIPPFQLYYTYNGKNYSIYGFVPNLTAISENLSANTTLSITYSLYAPVYGGVPVGVNTTTIPSPSGVNLTTYFVKYNTYFNINISSTRPLVNVTVNPLPDMTGSHATIIADTHSWDFTNLTINATGPANITYATLPNPHYSHHSIVANQLNITQLNNYPAYQPYIKAFSWTIINQINNSIRQSTNESITLSSAEMVMLNLSMIWGQNYTLIIYGYGGSVNLTDYTLQGYISPASAYIRIPHIAVVNGTVVNGYIIKPMSNGFYKLNIRGYAYMVVNSTGKAPQFFLITPPQTGVTVWQNVSLAYSANYTVESYNLTQMFYNNMLNLSHIPHSFSYIFGNYSVTMLNKTPIMDLVAVESSNANAGPVTLNFTVVPNIRYKFQVLTNTTQNIVYNFSTSQNYYDFTWGDWAVDPMFNLTQYPVAVITAPSAVAYDTAVVISGANSYAAITNYTWHISGPATYTEYGPTPSIFFSITGVYTIQLTITNSAGLTNHTTTSLAVVASSQDSNIVITYSYQKLANGNYEYTVTVTAHDNVSINQFTVYVDSQFVNTTFVKQAGNQYTYTFILNAAKFGYGNHTIKMTAWDILDQYNTATTHLVFGSTSSVGGFIALITSNILYIFIAAFVVFAFVVFGLGVGEYVEAKHGKKSSAKKHQRKSRKVRK